MKIIIESTPHVVMVGPFPCRVWTGKTAEGAEIEVLISLIKVKGSQVTKEFADVREIFVKKDQVPRAPC